jgi:hypothetical protein
MTMSEPKAVYRVGTKAGIDAALGKNITEIKAGLIDESFNFQPPEPEMVSCLFGAQGWSQTFIASRLHVDVSTVRRWTAPTNQTQHSRIRYTEWLLLLIMSGNIKEMCVETAIQKYA